MGLIYNFDLKAAISGLSSISVCTSVPLGTGILFRVAIFPLNDPLCTVPYDQCPTNSLNCKSLYGTESPAQKQCH